MSQMKMETRAASEDKGTHIATAAAGGASILIALQVGSRALTFLVNQILLRYLAPEILGIATHLEVYSISVLFFARESLRIAIQRQTNEPQKDFRAPEKTTGKVTRNDHVDASTSAGKTQTLVNLSYVSIFLGIIFTLVLAWVYSNNTYGAIRSGVPYFALSLKIYGFAAVCELLSEPVFVVIQQKSNYGIRGRVESIATLLRCFATTASAIWAAENRLDIGVLPFAIGQAVYAVTLSGMYYISRWHIEDAGTFSLLPTAIYSRDASYYYSYLSKPFIVLGGSIFLQSVVKHVLTQGDTLLIASLTSPTVQGAYALANNYGGLLARLLLQPIEESSRNYFSKLLSDKESRPSKEVVERARDNLAYILRAYVLSSIFIIVVGPTLAPVFLRTIAGPRWIESGAGEVLASYCYYIPLLAINGVTEAFVSSVASKSEINRQSTWMLFFSLAFAISAFYFLVIQDMGAKGLVWANAVNMSLRIIWSCAFIGRYLRRNGTRFQLVKLRPEPMVVAASVGAMALVLNLSTIHLTGTNKDIIKGGIPAAIYGITILISEHDYIYQCYLALYG